MVQKDINCDELRDFVELHKLRNSVSIIHFNALVSINTAINSISNKRIAVMISFNNFRSYGEVKFLPGD